MTPLAIIFTVWAAMIATSVWESRIEGLNSWDKGKLGWKLKGKRYVWLTSYHFWLFVIMFPLLIIVLPLVVAGYNASLLRVLLFSYVTGMVLQDFFWFVTNPLWRIRDFGPKKVDWYPWIRFGRFGIPVGYALGILVAVLILLL